ncbi:MAG: hypothetical protein LKE33_09085 [Acidaminococcus sp.]|jgi:hypothetical protein|nr:hypothetical protein [Acidaminococcus sp.]MCI2099418.1 hypothetical protein [Acidaminococcus sp.]MCI2113778.1 hypothetical protein [Acidaminococcus sp.]MCI2115648.1 hypothetical protein [Acidaminococcus sp.]
MKKQILGLTLSLLALCGASRCFAKDDTAWDLVQENKAGIYYVSRESVEKTLKKPEAPQVYKVRTKAVFKDEPFIRLLNEHFGKKLKEGDSASSCELILSLNTEDDTYRVEKVELFSKKGKRLVKKSLEEEFQTIPQSTYVSVLEKKLKEQNTAPVTQEKKDSDGTEDKKDKADSKDKMNQTGVKDKKNQKGTTINNDESKRI